MASRSEILAFLDGYLEVDSFEDYNPIGLQVEGRDEVRRVATGVSVSMELLEQAGEWGADMALVHHGMFWAHEERVLRGFRKERIAFLLRNDITLAAYHLPLDAHPEVGNNILFARAMKFFDIEPFGHYKGKLIGYKGKLDPLSTQDFLRKARKFYGTEPTAFLSGPPTIQAAAVISGGAWDHIEEAALEGVDCFVTGNADEPAYSLANELGVHFLAFGHYATERVGIRRLGERLGEVFHDVEVRFFDIGNPL